VQVISFGIAPFAIAGIGDCVAVEVRKQIIDLDADPQTQIADAEVQSVLSRHPGYQKVGASNLEDSVALAELYSIEAKLRDAQWTGTLPRDSAADPMVSVPELTRQYTQKAINYFRQMGVPGREIKIIHERGPGRSPGESLGYEIAPSLDHPLSRMALRIDALWRTKLVFSPESNLEYNFNAGYEPTKKRIFLPIKAALAVSERGIRDRGFSLIFDPSGVHEANHAWIDHKLNSGTAVLFGDVFTADLGGQVSPAPLAGYMNYFSSSEPSAYSLNVAIELGRLKRLDPEAYRGLRGRSGYRSARFAADQGSSASQELVQIYTLIEKSLTEFDITKIMSSSAVSVEVKKVNHEGVRTEFDHDNHRSVVGPSGERRVTLVGKATIAYGNKAKGEIYFWNQNQIRAAEAFELLQRKFMDGDYLPRGASAETTELATRAFQAEYIQAFQALRSALLPEIKTRAEFHRRGAEVFKETQAALSDWPELDQPGELSDPMAAQLLKNRAIKRDQTVAKARKSIGSVRGYYREASRLYSQGKSPLINPARLGEGPASSPATRMGSHSSPLPAQAEPTSFFKRLFGTVLNR
jgi:hypothetical protein